MNNQLLCLENSGQTPRWLKILVRDDQVVVIDSPDYAILDSGYAMEFHDGTEFQSWINEQQAQGWQVTFRSEDPTISLDDQTLMLLHDRVFQILIH
jgi:hypothetical protein